MEKYLAFEECNVTTMTLIFILDGSVSLDPAFSLLPITRIEFTPPKRQKKKFELPHCAIPGAILSMRFKGDTRGIIRSATGKFFKNSITIDLSTISKNVSIKLSRGKIQMCGASSEDQGTEGAQYLIEQLLLVQEELDYIQSNHTAAQETLEWLIEGTKGKEVIRPVYKTVIKTSIDEETGEEVKTPEQVFSHNEDDNAIETIEDLSKAPDTRVASFLFRQRADFDYYSFFVSEIEWILTIKKVTTRPLAIKKVYKAMVNYNYNLGFEVDRFALHVQMLDRNGFISSFDNCVEHCVKIKLPYTPDDDERTVRRKNKVPCHCFLVYKSGVVTQTGPGKEKMKEAYDLFWNCILEIKDKITLNEAPIQRKRVVIRRQAQR